MSMSEERSKRCDGFERVGKLYNMSSRRQKDTTSEMYAMKTDTKLILLFSFVICNENVSF